MCVHLLRWRKSHRGSVRVKSKPQPPPKRRWKKSNDEDGNKGNEDGFEMRNLPETSEVDKDCYYEHLSNIGIIIIIHTGQ